MAHGQLIFLQASDDGVGRGALLRELVRQWTLRGEAAIGLGISLNKEGLSRVDPQAWLQRYGGLSPLLQRNALADLRQDQLLQIDGWMNEAVSREWFGALKTLYRWVLVSAPLDESKGCGYFLDAVDASLSVTTPIGLSPQVVRALRETLGRQHFPLAYHHWVLNRSPKVLTRLPEGFQPLVSLPEDHGLGIRWREAVKGFSARLKEEPGLFKPTTSCSSEEGVSQKILESLKTRIQPQLMDVMEHASAGKEADQAQAIISAALAEENGLPVDRRQREEAMHRVLDDVLGLGPLEILLKDPEVSEVMVNGHGCIYVEKRGKLHRSDLSLASEAQLRTLIDRIVAPLGRRVDESVPLCDARLSDGSRVNIVLPPLALDGPTLTIRKFMARRLALEDLAELGSMTAAMADFLRASVIMRKNILVSGGTGSGKTTLLNALSSAIPDDERIVTIEDAAELRLLKPHVVRMESRPPNAEGQGEIPIRRLVINALRMRPDRIVVGECRGGEALDMLQAMNTGHDGSLTTVHANAPRDALGRLETLVLMAGMDLPLRVVREQIRSAIHLIVQQARLADGSRKVTSITEVTGMEQETLVTQELFRLRQGTFEATGNVSRGGWPG